MRGGVSILDVALRLGAKFKFGGGVERCGPCPACGGDDRFSINIAKGVFNCRWCAVGGDAIALARHVNGMSYAEALAFVGDERAYALVRRDLAVARQPPAPTAPNAHMCDDETVAPALALWREAADPRGTVAERYLNLRGLALDDRIAWCALRWHGGIGALLALFRNIGTGEPQAISRIFISRDGRKIEPKFLGPVGGAAIMFDRSTDTLTIAEGLETALTERAFGAGPTWACGSAGAIARLPVIDGVRLLRICVERDPSGTNERAALMCAKRWEAAGRRVSFKLPPPRCKDANDAIRQDRK